MKKIKATIEEQGQRLDKFLNEQLKDTTRSQIKKKIQNKEILVNNKGAAVHHFLKEGDVITFLSDKQISKIQGTITKQTSNSKNQISKKEKKDKPKKKGYKLSDMVVAETDDYLIITKPTGLIVHHGDKTESETVLTDILLKQYPELKKVGEDPARPGIVHRLDKDVSGLMAVAKTQEMFEWLKKDFKRREIKKEYTALVFGVVEKPSGIIDFAIDRDKDSNKMIALPITKTSASLKTKKQKNKGTEIISEISGKAQSMKSRANPEGRDAITEFEVIKNFQQYTLLEITIKTGRTHQIRIHMKAYGHPIVGDELYPSKRYKQRKDIERPFLHSTTLGFMDLNSRWVEFSVPLPQELKTFLEKLK